MLATKQYQQGLISFLCLSYNHVDFLKDCLESIWNQKYENIEIIALDDGSSDSSPDLLQSLAKSSPFPMKVILQKNSGNIARNFNILISEAQGEYLFMTSMDDYFEPDAVSSKLHFFENDPHMCFVSNLVKNTIDADGNILEKAIPLVEWNNEVNSGVEDLIAGTLELVTLVALQGTMIRSMHVDAVGGFDEDLLGDDLILFTKLFFYMKERPELRFEMLDRAAINYRLHSNNISKKNVRMARLSAEWLNRYFPDHPIPAHLFLSLKSWLVDSLVRGETEEAFAFIQIFNELLKKESIDSRRHFVDLLLMGDDNRRRYLIPFFFEIKERKNLLVHRICLTVFGLKAVELVFKKHVGRCFVTMILFNAIKWRFQKE